MGIGPVSPSERSVMSDPELSFIFLLYHPVDEIRLGPTHKVSVLPRQIRDASEAAEQAAVPFEQVRDLNPSGEPSSGFGR
jgi:hypothetical protein